MRCLSRMHSASYMKKIIHLAEKLQHIIRRTLREKTPSYLYACAQCKKQFFLFPILGNNRQIVYMLIEVRCFIS